MILPEFIIMEVALQVSPLPWIGRSFPGAKFSPLSGPHKSEGSRSSESKSKSGKEDCILAILFMVRMKLWSPAGATMIGLGFVGVDSTMGLS